MSTTEKRVIGGLQQLTHMLFNDHFKANRASDAEANSADKENSGGKFIQSDEISSSIERPSTSFDTSQVVEADSAGSIRLMYDDAHSGSEKFCAMVVRQIAHLEEYEDWHDTQLNAYDNASGQFFKRI